MIFKRCRGIIGLQSLLLLGLLIFLALLTPLWLPQSFFQSTWSIMLAALSLAIVLVTLVYRVLQPWRRLFAQLRDGLDSLHDGDFSLQLATPSDPMRAELVARFNRLSEQWRSQRHRVQERELLLTAALDNDPAAIVLVQQPDTICYVNASAQALLGINREGLLPDAAQGSAALWSALSARCVVALHEVIQRGEDALFTINEDGEPAFYHYTQRQLLLQGLLHRLIVIRPMSRELHRQEAKIWKKVIRLLCHEVNNSLAPISSLLHSAKQIVVTQQSVERLPQILDIAAERSQHLNHFLQQYANLSRLPEPNKTIFQWQHLLDHLAAVHVFAVQGNVPLTGYGDPVQLEQALINLLKNAHDSTSPTEAIVLQFEQGSEHIKIHVLDRGSGLSEAQLKQALLPFYSTKPGGTGLGLPLCREIIEAHGGSLQIANRTGGGAVVSLRLPSPV